MRKPFVIAISIALLLSLAACGKTVSEAVMLPVTGIAGAWFTEELPEDSAGSADVLRVGRTYDGKDIFSLVRVPVPEGTRAIEAWLSLKILENNGASALLAGALTGPWEGDITREGALALAGDLQPARQALTMDGRVRIDVTAHVKAWLDGTGNHGLILFEANDSTESVFVLQDGEDEPRLEIIVHK